MTTDTSYEAFIGEACAQQVSTAMSEVHARGYMPGWILLGHEEWTALRQYMARTGELAVPLGRAPEPLRFRGVRLAHVALQSHLEVTRTLPDWER